MHRGLLRDEHAASTQSGGPSRLAQKLTSVRHAGSIDLQAVFIDLQAVQARGCALSWLLVSLRRDKLLLQLLQLLPLLALLHANVAAWCSLLLLFLQHAQKLTLSPPAFISCPWVVSCAVVKLICASLILSFKLGLPRVCREGFVYLLTALCGELLVRLPQAASFHCRARST